MARKTMRLMLAVAAWVLVALPGAAGAAPITVETFMDVNMPGNGQCSLREAVNSANDGTMTAGGDCEAGDAATPDSINLAVGTYTLTGAAGDEMNLTGDLDIVGGGPVVINGFADGVTNVPTTIIDAGNNDRIFDMQPSGAVVDLNVNETILQNGNVAGGADGGAIRVGDPDGKLQITTARLVGNDAGHYGGAISFDNATAGSLFDIEEVELSGNTAGDDGGALYLDMPDQDPNPQPAIDNSAFVNNSSGAMGGAIYEETRAMDGPLLFITNTTISGNSAVGGGGALSFAQAEGGNAYFNFSTIANNTTATAGTGGAIQSTMGGLNGQFILFNTGNTVSGNTAAGSTSNCVGPGNFDSLAYNIESANSCFGGAPAMTDLVNTNPLLGPLAYNTVGVGALLVSRTHGLYDTSPGRNLVPPGDCPSSGNDQRYVTRPVETNCDVGAFEGSLGPAPDTDGDGLVDPADNCPTLAGPASNGGCPLPPVTPTTPTATATPAKVCPKKKKKKKKKRSASAAKKKKKKKKKKC